MSKTVIASACLCGISCRWHGKKCHKVQTIQNLENQGYKIIPVCPEELGGLSTPRPPVKTIKGKVFQVDDETRSLIGQEVTEKFQLGAQKCLEIAKKNNVTTAYMFKLSPSCAIGGITGKYLKSKGITVIPSW